MVFRPLSPLATGALCAVAWALSAEETPLNVVACGADPSGQRDCTLLLQEIHRRGRPVYYPSGTYRFNGETLDFSAGTTFESPDGVVIRNDLSPEPVVVRDDRGLLIGLQQNPLEHDERVLGRRARMSSGSLVPPPVSQTRTSTAVDVVAHWYNDAGLECRRSGGGWVGWYYWSWAFHDSRISDGRGGDPYDPARHPLLGFYRGDDPVVLDWQCYWLLEYGVKAVSLSCGKLDLEHWAAPESPGHWVYQLFHQVPNFQRLRYVLWAPSPWLEASAANRQVVEDGWAELINRVYLKHANFYALECRGKRYPVLYVYEGEALRGVFDQYKGSGQTAAFLRRMAKMFQTAGYGGVALFVRHATSGQLLDRAALKREGVLYFEAGYSEDYGQGATYAERVASYAPPTGKQTILNVRRAIRRLRIRAGGTARATRRRSSGRRSKKRSRTFRPTAWPRF